MRKTFLFLLSIFCVLCCSCSSSFKCGLYGSKKDNPNPNSFEFFEDSTFTYRYHLSIRKESSGKFKIIKDKLILNSFIKDTTLPMEYSLHSNDSLNGKNRITVKFEVPERRKIKDFAAYPIINNDSLDVDYGEYSIYYDSPLDSLKFDVIVYPFVFGVAKEPLMTKTVYFDKETGKDILVNISIDDSLFGYRIFDNTQLDIKRNRILFYEDKEIFDYISKKFIRSIFVTTLYRDDPNKDDD